VRLVQASDKRRLRAIPALDHARLAVQKRSIVCRHHPHLHLAALQQFIEPLVALPVHQGVDLVESLVPLLFQRRFPRQPRRLDVGRVQVAVADDLDRINSLDLFINEFED